MLLGLCGTITFELIFGLSQNFGWAVATRFMWGLLNGNVGIGKTYISEVRCMLWCRILVTGVGRNSQGEVSSNTSSA